MAPLSDERTQRATLLVLTVCRTMSDFASMLAEVDELQPAYESKSGSIATPLEFMPRRRTVQFRQRDPAAVVVLRALREVEMLEDMQDKAKSELNALRQREVRCFGRRSHQPWPRLCSFAFVSRSRPSTALP